MRRHKDDWYGIGVMHLSHDTMKLIRDWCIRNVDSNDWEYTGSVWLYLRNDVDTVAIKLAFPL